MGAGGGAAEGGQKGGDQRIVRGDGRAALVGVSVRLCVCACVCVCACARPRAQALVRAWAPACASVLHGCVRMDSPSMLCGMQVDAPAEELMFTVQDACNCDLVQLLRSQCFECVLKHLPRNAKL
eukprot:1156593-Pelagomonas_calceolata.AAC.2